MDSKDDHPEDADALTQLYLRDVGESRRRKLWLGAAASAILLFAGAGAVAISMLAPQMAAFKDRVAAPETATALKPDPVPEATGDPVPILPEEPAGTTVLVKQPDREAQADRALAAAAPVASGSQVANGYSLDLGAAQSFTELSRRFAEIARANQEIPFDALEPRATLKDTPEGLAARLVVGPFATEDEAASTCEQIALPAGIECKAAPFEGELIARQ
jgi:hypothetical protein